VIRNSRHLKYLGKDFRYDNRFLPVLLPSYLTDIRRLTHSVPLDASPSLVDLGANVGQFAATFLWRFPEARVWSFEPNPTIVPLLDQNAADTPNWQVLPWGIAQRDGEATLWSVQGKSGQGSVFPRNAAAGLRSDVLIEQRVSLRRLSEERMTALGIPGVVDVLKVDVEGAEESALLGVADLTWRFLVIETSLNRDGGLTLSDALALTEEIWRVRPDVVWSATVTPDAATADVVLAMPQRI
jgi:FkbM family methyltransferase